MHPIASLTLWSVLIYRAFFPLCNKGMHFTCHSQSHLFLLSS